MLLTLSTIEKKKTMHGYLQMRATADSDRIHPQWVAAKRDWRNDWSFGMHTWMMNTEDCKEIWQSLQSD